MHFDVLTIFRFLLFNLFSEATTDDDISEIADEEQETLLTYDILLECTKITPIGKFWRFIDLCFCSPIVFYFTRIFIEFICFIFSEVQKGGVGRWQQLWYDLHHWQRTWVEQLIFIFLSDFCPISSKWTDNLQPQHFGWARPTFVAPSSKIISNESELPLRIVFLHWSFW